MLCENRLNLIAVAINRLYYTNTTEFVMYITNNPLTFKILPLYRARERERKRLQILFLTAMTFFLTGCGYGFRGSESALPPDVERIHIPMVTNQSTEAGVDILVTEALRDEFDRYGTLTVVDKQSQADAVLDTTIVSIKRERGATSSSTDTDLQLQTVMTLSAELRKRNGALLWRNENIKASKVFGAESGVVVASSADFAGGSLSSGDLANLDDREVSRGQEQQALEDLSEQVASQIYSAAVIPEF